MCYNCGCGDPNDDMGVGHAGVDPEGKSITNKTFAAAAESQGMHAKQAMEETLKMLQKEVSKQK
jgi:hypothetical protein